MNVEVIDEQAARPTESTVDGDGDDPLSPGSPRPGAVRVPDLATIGLWAEVTLRGERLPDDTEVTVSLVDEAAVAELNERHLGREGPTDVLSFPIEDMTPGVPWESSPDGPPLVLGDVFVCPQVVQRNAAAAGVPFASEMALMVVHGLLHLLGYDHVEDADAELMEGRERIHLAKVGVDRP